MQSQHATPPKPVPIAPAPSHGTNGPATQPTMPYTCLSCARRKIRCDKLTPTCSACWKGKLECSYQAPAPRRRKRKPSGDIHEKLAEYERILRENNLLPSEDQTPATQLDQESFALRFLEPEIARLGKLVIDDEGKSRYVDGNFWRNIGADEEIPVLDDDDENPAESGDAAFFALDPFTAALMGATVDLTDYHPPFDEAQLLWKTYVENVEPIVRILHIPSTAQMVRRVSASPQLATKTEECIIFAVYHFAVFALPDDDCLRLLNESKDALLQRYHFAAKQALVNVDFLKSTEMSVLQAYVLYLMPARFTYDPNVLWILTGVAVRLAQRIGLHREPESLGLPPFEVQMRRRLFFQLVPLDGGASQMSGTGIAMMPHTWDTGAPLNVNDDQIWPGMTETPQEQKGPTDMIFCLTRATLGKFFARTGFMGHGGTMKGDRTDYAEIEPLIVESEREVEEKFLRYCDPIDPLHFLTMGLARAAISAMRIRARLPRVRNKIATRAEKQEILQFALKILDTDAAAYTNGSLKKYLWHAKAFFAWGSWDSLIFMLTTLRDPGVFTPAEVDAAWRRIEQAYINHGQFLGFKRSMQNVTIARLTLKTWHVNPPSNNTPEPPFISALRALRKVGTQVPGQGQSGDAPELERTTTTSPSEPSPPSDMAMAVDGLSAEQSMDLGADLDLDSNDWVFWEKLIKDFQAGG